MMNGEKIMSEHVWCHGPNCHTNHTVDRVRGSKGAKVLRTRKIKFYEISCAHDLHYKSDLSVFKIDRIKSLL